jgi:hypothetical protein
VKAGPVATSAGEKVPVGQPGTTAAVALTAVSAAAAAAALVLTWLRLFVGMDLRDESFYVLVPWRWALGDKPFVNEQNLASLPGFVMYPFAKLFAVVRGYDVTGYVLYMRHVYLLMMIAVAVAVFLLLRRLVRWQLALLVATVFVTLIFWATPQLSYNTIAIAFLTLGAVLGAWVVVLGKGRWYALASGAAFGTAVAVYPSLLFIVPFYAFFLALARGHRSVAALAEGAIRHAPDPAGPATGKAAWHALSAWVAGGALVLVPLALVMLSFGPRNIARSWQFTMSGAAHLHQLGGASKALDVARGSWDFLMWRPYLLVAALLMYFVYRRAPRLGRALLATVPLALWLAAQRPMLWASGSVAIYALLAPFLYLFVPREKRHTGARLLLWVWAPAMIAGAMTSYTSAAGYVSAAVGFMPALVLSGLFLAWALEAVWRPAVPWLALAVLVAVVGVTVAFQYQFEQRDVPYSQLTSRFDSGPWWGIKVTPERRSLMDSYAADLPAQTRADDALFVFDEGSGYYLYWNGAIASNTYWGGLDPKTGQLTQATVSYYRRHRVVPTLIVHLIRTAGMTDAELQAASGGLDYPPTLVRPSYAFQRKPADETTQDVLARLPRH